MNRQILEKRTKQFHIDVIRICRQMPRDTAGFETGKQLIRSAGSVGANYRASRRAKSDADFLYKMEVVLEEADESHYWLQVTLESEIIKTEEVERLIQEANELTAIFCTVCKTCETKLNLPDAEKKAAKKSTRKKTGKSKDENPDSKSRSDI
jgi:four helix bundle protein